MTDVLDVLPVASPAVTERDMLDALTRRYTALRPGTKASDRWVRAEHVQSRIGDAGWRGPTRGVPAERVQFRIADFIAMDTYPSTQAVHGIEVKVSRADWLAELADGSKAETFKRHCHFWWLAVPDASIVRDDLPDGWGLLVLGKAGLRARIAAPLLDPDPIPLDLTMTIARAAARTAVRHTALAEVGLGTPPEHREAP